MDHRELQRRAGNVRCLTDMSPAGPGGAVAGRVGAAAEGMDRGARVAAFLWLRAVFSLSLDLLRDGDG